MKDTDQFENLRRWNQFSFSIAGSPTEKNSQKIYNRVLKGIIFFIIFIVISQFVESIKKSKELKRSERSMGHIQIVKI